MATAQASPVPAWMAVSREQNDHPLCREDHTFGAMPTAIADASQSLIVSAWRIYGPRSWGQT
jgi:hypothetical protein